MIQKLSTIASLVAVSFLAAISFAAVNTAKVNVLSYASTNVTTSSYVTLIASTPTASAHLEVCDTSGKLLKLATGSAGNETDFATVAPSGCVVIGFYTAAGTRVAIKAIDATATTGYSMVSLLP